jgi:hypothetical protein
LLPCALSKSNSDGFYQLPCEPTEENPMPWQGKLALL